MDDRNRDKKFSDCDRKFMEGDYDKKASYIWFQVKKTQVEMMFDRGLEIPEEELFLLSFDPEKETLTVWEQRTMHIFVEMYRKKADAEGVNFNAVLSNAYPDSTTNVNTVVVYLCRERESLSITSDEFKTKFYIYLNEYFSSSRPLKMIFISEVTLNRKEECVEKLNFVSCQFFLTEHLIHNPTQHALTPPHTLLNEEERRREMDENNLRPSTLPVLLKTDPIVRYYDWEVGGIVHIARTEHYLEIPAPKTPYYRRIQ